MKKLMCLLAFYFLPGLAMAQDAPPEQIVGIGRVAENLMEPITVLSDFVNSTCFVIGSAFLFTSVIKYFEHRRSPLMVPIGTVVFLVIAGIALILLPFLSLVVDWHP